MILSRWFCDDFYATTVQLARRWLLSDLIAAARYHLYICL